MIIERNVSRISDAPLIELFSLGDIYLSDFIDDPLSSIVKAPLTLALDTKSGLLQLKHTVHPDNLYRQYWYRSSINKAMVRELTNIVAKARSLIDYSKRDNIVLDIGCNDGTLLRFYGDDFYKVGFDPAVNLKKYSQKYADLIVADYFTSSAYFRELNKKAKIVTTIAMFYDLDDPHKFLDDLNAVLDSQGLWIVQMSYLPLMLEQLAFDNICHEHLEYYSLSSFKYLIEQHSLNIIDIELNEVNGGSFRAYVMKKDGDEGLLMSGPARDVARFRIDSLLAYEKQLDLISPETYIKWFKKIVTLRDQVVTFIKSERAMGKRIWGYGASTKGNTLLQWYGLDSSLIEAIAERNPAKYGKWTAGTNIPIKPEAEMREVNPDYLLILPWHFISDFRYREKKYLRNGGKFIVPCPRFEIITH